MGRLERLLVPVTGDEHSLYALDQILEFAATRKCRVAVLSVVPPYTGDLGSSALADLKRLLRQPSELALARALEMANARGMDIDCLCEEGEPFEVIVDTARRLKADLVAMGVADRSALGRLVRGNVPLRTIGHSDRDVLLVPQGAVLGFRSILLATDGSRYCTYAAVTALQLAREHDADLHVLYVADLAFPDSAEGQLAADMEVEHGRAVVEAIAARAAQEGVRARGHVAQGEAAERILATARRLGAECLFIASHGKGGLARLLLGSVAEEVVASAHIPVYVAVRDRLRR
ncbi:universal stress protein [Nitratidesulfovibrio sp. SRB-5]|uniref:universal stress protein n=1 Tax=Nitratidesulfovibrio sp. SRB-5 TaxID=2872636 RepID=UPI001025B2A9|nr:universal stress protein [Nitratidesulfovibrio sp. SRB-5]MBZ2173281.1 universal stress protein [Nitratidesulfovibrio sp. SRB-5]RXF77851.1 universal stress protein [Desulfovibrio sp. DS-1]